MPQDVVGDGASLAALRRRTTVLLVEGDTTLRRALLHVTRRQGYEVHDTGTIAGALDLIVRHGDNIDLALLDYLLPTGIPRTTGAGEALEGVQGASTAEVIADFLYRHRIGTSIVYMTGNPPGSMRHVVAGTRADACLHKPFHAEHVVTEVDRVLQRRRSRISLDLQPTELPERSCAMQPGAFREGIFRLMVRLAGRAAESDEMRKVLRTILDGVAVDSAGRTCGMSRSTYVRRKAELRTLLGLKSSSSFLGTVLARIDDALVRGDIDLGDLVAENADAEACEYK